MQHESTAPVVARSAIWDGRTPPKPGAAPDAPWQKLCPYCDAPLSKTEVFRPGHCAAAACGHRHILLLNYLAEEGRRAAYHADCEAAEPRQAARALAVKEGCEADDVVSVIVPYQNTAVVPLPGERRDAFLAHLAEAVVEAFEKEPVVGAVEVPPEAAAPLTIAGCSTCQGYCCKQGADRNAFLTAGELVEIRARRPDMDAKALIAFYEAALPEASVEGACVYQGPLGCVLSRDVRSSVCNTFHCRELIEAFARVGDMPGAPVTILARSDEGVEAIGAMGADKVWRLM